MWNFLNYNYHKCRLFTSPQYTIDEVWDFLLYKEQQEESLKEIMKNVMNWIKKYEN